MITNHEKFRLIDENKNGEFFIEVNWNEKDATINECKLLKFVFPDGKCIFVKREHLNAILFAIGKEEDQRKMIPLKLSHVKWYETTVSIKAKKDIHKGENITFPIKITLPSVEQEAISEIKRRGI